MRYDRLSRNKSLKIPKTIKSEAGQINTMEDLFAVKQAVTMAHNRKFDKDGAGGAAAEKDTELEQISKISEESSDLVVITKIKKLGAYVVAVTQKSPAKFRGVFVNRMQNFCLEALQDVLYANFIRQDSAENKKLREKYQSDAIVKLKMIAYIAMLAENAGCILAR